MDGTNPNTELQIDAMLETVDAPPQQDRLGTCRCTEAHPQGCADPSCYYRHDCEPNEVPSLDPLRAFIERVKDRGC